MSAKRPTRRFASAAALALTALVACGGDEHTAETADVASAGPASAAQPARVALATLSAEVLPATVAASGTIEARRLTEIGADVPGTLARVHVDVGDAVRAGDPLFRIDPGPYEMALAEARAGLALARAEQVNADAEAERMARLVEQNAASVQRADQLRTQAAVAGARAQQMAARVARAERDLARTTVRAPYAGSVVERRAHEGALAGAAPVLVLQESGALEAILDVPETTPVAVGVGDRARLFAQGLAEPIAATVARVSERVDPATRTYQVRCEVVDPSGAVKAGSYVRAELDVSRGTPYPVAPRSALVLRDGRSYVLRVEQGVVREVPVRVGIVSGDRVELLSGVAAGERVVEGEAAQRLVDGAAVVAESPPLASAGESAP